MVKFDCDCFYKHKNIFRLIFFIGFKQLNLPRFYENRFLKHHSLFSIFQLLTTYAAFEYMSVGSLRNILNSLGKISAVTLGYILFNVSRRGVGKKFCLFRFLFLGFCFPFFPKIRKSDQKKLFKLFKNALAKGSKS